MRRVKVNIKRLEKYNRRQTTYSKRKNGIMKKANELSILCDIDIVVLMFSPTGKPTLYKGNDSKIEEMIEKFAQLTPLERAIRQLEDLEALKTTFRKMGHDIRMEELLGPSSNYQSVEDLAAQVNVLRFRLSDVHERLSCWTKLDKIDSIEHLEQMEESLSRSLDQVRTHKESLGKQQLGIHCADQFENGIHLPFSLGMERELQPLSWISNDHSQHMGLPTDLNLLLQRDTECCPGTSFGGHSCFFGAGEKVDVPNIEQESGFFNELSRPELGIEPYEQHPYQSDDFSLLCDIKFKPVVQMNMQENALNYCGDRNYELPPSGYELTNHSWASTSGTCAVATLDEHLYPPLHYTSDEHVAKDLDVLYAEATHHPS